jgi:CubicO group peptidase (beta-lactamase class C family)
VRTDLVLAQVRDLPTTALLVKAGNETVLAYGDVSEVSYLASARKSVLSILYGQPVADGVIDLDATLADLDIDDVDGLLAGERQATVRHLLTASSGVYHPAAGPGGDEADLPARGAHAPGTRFHYNNWDFNVLGTIFEQVTGRAVFDALQELAGELGFQDFDRDRQRQLGVPERSRHLAHHMFLSARDLARLGRAMLDGGRPVIPADWVVRSTSLQVKPGPGRPLGYGYLWWLPPMWPGSFLAAGNYGQYLFCVPDRDLVVVHRRAVSDEFAIARNKTLGDIDAPQGVSIRQFLKLMATLLRA